jgi:hypothetical protein
MLFTSGAPNRTSANFARHALSDFDPGLQVSTGMHYRSVGNCEDMGLALKVIGEVTTTI